jgi:hypothetical protein
MPVCNMMAPTHPKQKRCGNCRWQPTIRRDGICSQRWRQQHEYVH